MKTTVALTKHRRIIVEPNKVGGLHLTFEYGSGDFDLPIVLTPDQVGALIFGMEQALETIDQRHRQALATTRAAA